MTKTIRIGCGAGFAGDRPLRALELMLRSHPPLDYLVLECLAERTLSIRYRAMKSGGTGFDPRIEEWMKVLLSTAVANNTCIITNMGAADPEGAASVVSKVAKSLMLPTDVTVALVRENFAHSQSDSGQALFSSTYMGADTVVDALRAAARKPNVVITSRVADPSLFLAPLVHELGWTLTPEHPEQVHLLAQGTLMAHLLECGCHLSGGYYAHPSHPLRNLTLDELVGTCFPFAEVDETGRVVLCKPEGTLGELSVNTCTQQLVYEIGDPSSYITPDIVVDFTQVRFTALGESRVEATGARARSPKPPTLLRMTPLSAGWKGFGEVSYGGKDCVYRAWLAYKLVESWMEQYWRFTTGALHHSPSDASLEETAALRTKTSRIMGYLIGFNSLSLSPSMEDIGNGLWQSAAAQSAPEVRLRIDGLFVSPDDAAQLAREIEALYTNGPAGGGGIVTGTQPEIKLVRTLVPRSELSFQVSVLTVPAAAAPDSASTQQPPFASQRVPALPWNPALVGATRGRTPAPAASPAPAGVPVQLWSCAHSRAGDKDNRINLSLIPYHPGDVDRLAAVVGPAWVKARFLPLLDGAGEFAENPESTNFATRNSASSVAVSVYQLPGTHALNIVIDGVLDGGVAISRRIDRHGKTLSDVLLSLEVVLP